MAQDGTTITTNVCSSNSWNERAGRIETAVQWAVHNNDEELWLEGRLVKITRGIIYERHRYYDAAPRLVVLGKNTDECLLILSEPGSAYIHGKFSTNFQLPIGEFMWRKSKRIESECPRCKSEYWAQWSRLRSSNTHWIAGKSPRLTLIHRQ